MALLKTHHPAADDVAFRPERQTRAIPLRDDVLTRVASRPNPAPAAAYISSLAPGSRRAMTQSLRVIVALATGGRGSELGIDELSFPWHTLQQAHTSAIRAALLAEYKPATANRHLAALRGVIRSCWRLQLISEEQRSRASDLPPIRGRTLPRGRALAPEEVRAMLESCRQDRGLRGRRDAALLAVLWSCGLRRSEAAGLRVEDLNRETGELRVLRAKGAKARLAHVPPDSLLLLSRWLDAARLSSGPLFRPLTRLGRLTAREVGLGSQGVYMALRRRAARAGVESFTPHDLRRTFISELLDAGADVVTVQRLAGHAKPETTSRYDRRGERAQRAAARLRSLPSPGAARTRSAAGAPPRR